MHKPLIPALLIGFIFFMPSIGGTDTKQSSWSTDSAWHQGKAEWALYQARRTIYGKSREYEATIFTNKQLMDPKTTTKAVDSNEPGNVEVFKHNVSEIIPTERYDYRFLTTAFIRTNSLATFKIVVSTQEDCGTTYKQFLMTEPSQANWQSMSYFPNEGNKQQELQLPGDVRFHDALTLTLRDFPFDDPALANRKLSLISDQTDTHETPADSTKATIEYIGRKTITVPYGQVETHHLKVSHDPTGGTGESHYWFAADENNMRHVLVQYQGPWGVEYKLKRLDWWAYWRDPPPPPT